MVLIAAPLVTLVQVQACPVSNLVDCSLLSMFVMTVRQYCSLVFPYSAHGNGCFPLWHYVVFYFLTLFFFSSVLL